jgi:hypothetical protein
MGRKRQKKNCRHLCHGSEFDGYTDNDAYFPTDISQVDARRFEMDKTFKCNNQQSFQGLTNRDRNIPSKYDYFNLIELVIEIDPREDYISKYADGLEICTAFTFVGLGYGALHLIA